MKLRSVLHHLAAFVLTFCCVFPGRADDIDIYSNPTANSLQPPYTVIVLDLNLLGICNSVVTQTSNPNNPDAPQLCLNITNSIVLSDLLAGITSNPATYLTNLLLGNYTCTNSTTCSSSAGALCNLYGILGIASPVVQIPLLGPLLSPLLGGVSTLTCGTLNFLLGIPLLSNTINALLGGFVGQLVSGLVNPLLTTVVGRLPTAIIGLLNSTFSGILNLGQVGLISVLESILNNLINTNVAIMVSHADRSNATGAPASTCSFSELASIPGVRSTTSGCSNGAYMLVGFTSVVNQGTVSTLLTKVSSLLTNMLNPTNLLNSVTAILSTAVTTPTQLLPPYQGKEAYTELMHYLAGKSVYNAPLARWDGITALLPRDTTIESGSTYINPPLACRTANVLNVMLTNNIRDTESDSDLRSYLPGLPATGAITLGDVVKQTTDNGFKDKDDNTVKLRSFFLIQDLLSSTATLANTGSTVLTYANSLGLLGLGQSLADSLTSSLVTDANLLTTSVAGSRSSATGLLEAAYVPEFKPKASRKPTWEGNVKQLRLQRNTTTGAYSYVAANGVAGVASDGRINTAALTYWTRTTKIGGALVDGRNTALGGAGSNIPGYTFSGGGNPGRVNADAARILYYDQLSTSNVPSLGGLDADTQSVRDALKTDLGVTGTTAADDTTRRALLLQARGFDVGSTSAPKGTGATLTGVTGRPWLLGAVLHSRPVAVNYGARSGYTAADPDIRVLFGSADGFLHSIRNGHAASSTVDPAGTEAWAFMPRATMGNLKTLRDDTYSPQFPYGVDGAPAVLIIDRGTSSTITGGGPADGVIDSANANDHAYTFFGLRRGGSNYYGLDITNPDSPRLMWRIGTDGLYSANTATPGFSTGSAAWFSELGQTFSTPAIGRMRYSNSSNVIVDRSVLLFAGGYNGGVDASGNRIGKDLRNSRNATTANQVGTDDTRGNALYMVDALTGELIWKATRSASSAIVAYNATTMSFQHPLLQDSIPSDVTAVDSDGDGYTDRLYVGDTGGRVWRADFADTNRANWTLGPIASLGRSHGTADTTIANDRRFFHAPDFVPSRGKITETISAVTKTTTQNFDTILIGSGDREDPFNATTGNWLYAIRDRDIVSGKTLTDTTVNGVVSAESDARLFKQTDLTDLTSSCASSSTAVCAAGASLPNGWRLQLAGSGEKAVSAPVTINNAVTVSTYTPPAASTTRCVPDEGSSKIYGVNLIDSRPFVKQFIDDGDGSARSTAAGAPGIAGEVTALTPRLLEINSGTLDVSAPLIYRTFWRERREEEPERVKQ